MTEEKPVTATKSARKWALIALKTILTLVVVYYASDRLGKSWTEIQDYPWRVDALTVALSIVAHLLALLAFAAVWRRLISTFGFQLSLNHAFKINYVANLGRYIPGKIWQALGMLYYARRMNIREESALASWIIAQVFAIPAAFTAGALAALIYPQLLEAIPGGFAERGLYALTALSLLVSLGLVFLPNSALKIVNRLLHLLKRPPISFSMSIGDSLVIYLGYVACWALYGLAFWLFMRGITPELTVPPLAALGAFALAYQIGYLALFAPGGIGVRELALTAALQPFLGPLAAVVAVAARLWNMIVELLAALIALKIRL